MNTTVNFSDLIGKTIIEINGVIGEESLSIKCDDNTEYVMLHHDDCCESVSIDDIVGDLNDLLNSPILIASEDTDIETLKEKEYPDESFTWTFYNLATIKGHVTIKWYGCSNGYYSERVDFEQIK
jgi:hypothetical protein